MRAKSCLLACAALFALAAATAGAQSYPAKPIRVIVPFAAGGAADIQGRAISQKLAENLGQPVVVENRAGAGGNIGAELVAKSAPDGYTLLFTTSTNIVINPFLYQKLSYDPVRDFVAVAMCCGIAQVVVVNSSLGVSSLKELLDAARSKPGALSYGSMGNGSSGHLNMEALKRQAGIDVVHVPYKGAAPAVTDLVSGRISMMIVSYGVTQSHIRSGTLKALAIGSSARSSVLPGVPTASEAGLPGYEAPEWLGFFAPAATPRETVGRLNAEVVKIASSAELRDQWRRNGLEPPGVATPEQFAAFIRAELQRGGGLVKSTGARAD